MLRLANQDDLPFLQRMLFEASHPEGPPANPQAAEDPRVALYLQDWVRPGDGGLIALDDNGAQVGAAWYRLFSADRQAFGFVDEKIPELTIAVAPDSRGNGIGSQLMAGLKNMARAQGHGQLSLSVGPENLRARLLYAKVGFREVRTSEESIVMTVKLPPKRN